MKDHTYTVWITRDQKREQIGDSTKDPEIARRRARGIKTKPGRTVSIERDGKTLSNGKFGLDPEVYQLWLEANNDD